MKTRKENLRTVYVWELPVRIYHWLNALCILVLCVTGYLIGNPPAIMNSSEAVNSFWFGKIRFIHFTTSFIFIFNFLFRLYWGFVGNKYARWYNFIPFKKKQWREIINVIKIDILHIKGKPIERIGHNSMAYLIYFFLFLVFIFESLTGLGLYAQMSTSVFPQFFAWVLPLFGGDFVVRKLHHILMWMFILFTLVHVYLVLYHDYIERRGVTSSIIGGWKFIDEKDVQAEEQEERAMVKLKQHKKIVEKPREAEA